jgi:hypothetical protein
MINEIKIGTDDSPHTRYPFNGLQRSQRYLQQSLLRENQSVFWGGRYVINREQLETQNRSVKKRYNSTSVSY